MSIVCKFCGSDKLKKRGVVAKKQRYQCLSCLKTFRDGDDRQKFNDEDKLNSLNSYMESKSLRKTSGKHGVSAPIISGWLKEFEGDIKAKLSEVLASFNIKDITITEEEYSEDTPYKILIDGKNVVIIKKKIPIKKNDWSLF